jgi:hypothetical protein
MPTFIVTLSWTDQGIRDVKDAPLPRASSAKSWVLRSSICSSQPGTQICWLSSKLPTAPTSPSSP